MARTFIRANSDKLAVTAAPVGTAPITFTMACWFNAVNGATIQNLMDLDDGGGGSNFQGLRINFTTAGKVNVNTPATNATSTTSFTSSTWNHACGVWNGATSRAAFLNGGGKGTNATSFTPAGVSTVTLGGIITGAASALDGSLAECAIWNVALSDAEVAILGSPTGTTPVSPLLIRPQSLVFYAPLLSQGSPEAEIMRGANLTVTGATVSTHPRIFYPSRHQKYRYSKPVADTLFAQAVM